MVLDAVTRKMDAADKRMLDREALRNMIQQWNANRLDLFELSEPNENLEFHGVMRFYFQDSGQKIATKCIRVASDATVIDVIGTLIEKFRPDMRMLSLGSYTLWETHAPGDERQLEPHEKPLLVQLNWHADDREGRFLLKCCSQPDMPLSSINEKGDQNFKRKLSKREKKELKKKEKLSRLKSDTNDENRPVAEKLYSELPETSFTRSISNPEAVMRRRRQQKLERKLQQFRSEDGGPDTGGTLKIYGSSLCPDVPYKTLLLSVGDSAAAVLREMLDKYGLSRHEPAQYCLVQVDTTDDSEYILEDDECPLAIVMTHPHRSSIMFHVRRRPSEGQPRRRKKKPSGGAGARPGTDPMLIEVTPDGTALENGRRLRVADVVEVGSVNGTALQLYGPSIQPRHCVLAPTEGGHSVTPLHADAQVYVNGRRVTHTTRLQHGCLLKFGRVSTFRFVDPAQEQLISRNISQSQHYGSGSIYDRSGGGAWRAGQEAILPAVLEFPEAGQAQFLSAVISRLDPHAPAFKLAPVYTLYLCARYRASTHYRPELTPTERAHKLTAFLHHVATLIHATVQERRADSAAQAFWMANASELLHFLKCDRHVCSFSTQAQESLPITVQNAFSNLVSCFAEELRGAVWALARGGGDDTEATAPVLQALAAAMVLLRRCRVNAALTIQLFSHLFHFINAIAFNKLVSEPNNITPRWGASLSARLALLAAWAERQGLELAADCHLARTHRAARLIQGEYRTAEEVRAALAACFKLNSVQVRALLSPLLPADLVEAAVAHARALADELYRADGREIELEESEWLGTALLIPGDGFSAEVVRGVPPGLAEFVAPLQRGGLCRLAPQPHAVGLWTVYMHAHAAPPRRPPDPTPQLIQLHKNSNGMGLSIVAAKGAGQSKLGIYVKSVVAGGAAAADGRLAAGDQLLSVDGHSLVGISQENAAEYLVRTGPIVTLEVAKQGAVLHGLATLLHQPAYAQQRPGGGGVAGGRRASERDLPSRLAAEPVKPSKSTPALHQPPGPPPPQSPLSPPNLLSPGVRATASKSRSSHNLSSPPVDSFYQNLASVHDRRDSRWSSLRSSGGGRPQSAHFDEHHADLDRHQVNQANARAAKLAEMSEEVTRRQQLQYQHMQQHLQQQQQHSQQQQQHSQQQQQHSQQQQQHSQQQMFYKPATPQMYAPAAYDASSHPTSQPGPQPVSHDVPSPGPQSLQGSMHGLHNIQGSQAFISHNQQPTPQPHASYGQPQRYEWVQAGPPSPQRSQPPVAPKPPGPRRPELDPVELGQLSHGTPARVRADEVKHDTEQHAASAQEAASAYATHNPWQREERERQAEARRAAARARRDHTVAHLLALGATRTAAQNQQLRALQLERDFERRATQHQTDEGGNGEGSPEEESPPSEHPAERDSRLHGQHPQPPAPKSILKSNTRAETLNGFQTHPSPSEESRMSELSVNVSGMSVSAASGDPVPLVAPTPPERGSSFAVMATRRPPSPQSPAGTGRDKRVSFHERASEPPPAPPASSPPPMDVPAAPREDPDRFLEEAESMLDEVGAGAAHASPSAAHTPGVIGAQEVYRDPRTRRLAEQRARAAPAPVPEHLSFKEKMKMFALESGEASTPKDKVKISRAQRDIDAVH
ncbi:afadin isoform X3 [Pieris rapae]|uniref:afadin isoform X3 n=1 Tax=Pieris rapae TaxID=64459 RepID=UPI001E27D977|nr:afadin isoform X3 [Pieris rapae]